MCNPKGLGKDLVWSVIEIAQKLPRLLTTSSPPGGVWGSPQPYRQHRSHLDYQPQLVLVMGACEEPGMAWPYRQHSDYETISYPHSQASGQKAHYTSFPLRGHPSMFNISYFPKAFCEHRDLCVPNTSLPMLLPTNLGCLNSPYGKQVLSHQSYKVIGMLSNLLKSGDPNMHPENFYSYDLWSRIPTNLQVHLINSKYSRFPRIQILNFGFVASKSL